MGIVGARAEAAARDGAFRRKSPIWAGAFPVLAAAGFSVGSFVSSSPPWGFALAYDVLGAVLIATMILDGYGFDQDELRVYSMARLRVRRFQWRQIRYFEAGGYWRGAGVRLVDGRRVRLRANFGLYREQGESEVSRLEMARQSLQPRSAGGDSVPP